MMCGVLMSENGPFQFESREPVTPVQSKAICDILDRQIELQKLRNDAECERLREQRDTLLALLRPFGACADYLDSHARSLSDETGLWSPSSPDGSAPKITVAHVRNARAALESEQ